jgi:dolichol-phosphate mannosyltransferase
MDRRVYEENRQISAKNQWFRRMVSGLGYRQTVIEYEPGERKASRSAPLKKMLKLCLDVMTSFSLKPLKLAAFTGGALTFAGILYLFIVAYYKLFMDMDISMWHWLIMLQMLTTGFILMIISIFGLYIGRIHAETRGSGHAEYRIQDCIGIALRENKIGV